MEDIQVDGNGDLRCSNCGGKNFAQKRTRRAKVIGVTAGIATIGVAGALAPFIAKQKLYCQACGTYNQMGAAKPFRPKPPQTAKSAPNRPSSGPAKTSSGPVRKSSRGEDILFCLFLTALSVALFAWAIVAGSVLWSILTGLLVAFFVFMVVVASSIKRPVPSSHEPRQNPERSEADGRARP